MIIKEFATLQNTDDMFVGDTVSVDGCVGFFQYRRGDITVAVNFKERRGAKIPDNYRNFILHNIVSCRTVLTEKIVDDFYN